jgi:hypothetical protein
LSHKSNDLTVGYFYRMNWKAWTMILSADWRRKKKMVLPSTSLQWSKS